MSDSDKVFAGSIPDIYDEYLVPMIFEPYAEDLAIGSMRLPRPTFWGQLLAAA